MRAQGEVSTTPEVEARNWRASASPAAWLRLEVPLDLRRFGVNPLDWTTGGLRPKPPSGRVGTKRPLVD